MGRFLKQPDNLCGRKRGGGKVMAELRSAKKPKLAKEQVSQSSVDAQLRERYRRRLRFLLDEVKYLPDERKKSLLALFNIPIVQNKEHYYFPYYAFTNTVEDFESMKKWVDSSYKSKAKHYMAPSPKHSYNVVITVTGYSEDSHEEDDGEAEQLYEVDDQSQIISSGSYEGYENYEEISPPPSGIPGMSFSDRKNVRAAMEKVDVNDKRFQQLCNILTQRGGCPLDEEGNVEIIFDHLHDDVLQEIQALLCDLEE